MERLPRATASPARRPSSTRGSATARPGCGRGSASASRAGQWLPVGGTWIEPDCNLPVGRVARAPVPLRPALLRARARPPLHASSGTPTCSATTASSRSSCAAPASTRFLTQKLSWNRFNPPEHHTFRWAGHRRQRGARALPAGRHLQRRGDRAPSCAARRATSRTTSARRDSLLVFGYGDGGGGPTARDARDARARRATCRACRARRSRDPRGVLRRARGRARRLARGRRRALLRVPPRHLHDAGAHQARQPPRASGRCTTPSCSARASRRRAVAARGARRALWQTLLLNQFHDILPGSSIGEVHARAERDLADGRGGRRRASRDRRSRRGDGRSTPSACARARGRRDAAAALRVAEAPPCGVGRLVERRRRRARRARTATASCSRTRTCARSLGRDGTLRSLVEPRDGPRGARRARQRARALRGPPDRLRRVGPRPVPPRDARATARRPTAREVALADAAARRGRLRAPDRRAQPHAPDRPPRRRRPRGSSSTARSTGTRTTALLKVALPARRARAARDLRDAVRRRRAPDALLDAPRPRAVRGPRPPLRRPLRARLRRRAAVRLQPTAGRVLRRRAAHDACCARRAGPTPRPTSATTSSPTRSSRTRGGWQDAGVVAEALRFNAPLLLGERAAGAALAGLDRRAGLVLDTVKRAEDGDALVAPPLRGARRRAARRACASASRSPSARRANLLEDRLGAGARSTATRSSSPYRPFEIVDGAAGLTRRARQSRETEAHRVFRGSVVGEVGPVRATIRSPLKTPTSTSTAAAMITICARGSGRWRPRGRPRSRW